MKLIIAALLLWTCLANKLQNLFSTLNKMNEYLIFEYYANNSDVLGSKRVHVDTTYDQILRFFE